MQFRKLPNVQNVASNATFTVHVPVGPTYDAFMLRFSGTGAALAELDNIRLLVNGKVIQEFKDAVRLDDINKFHGRDAISASPFEMLLHMRRPEVQAFGPLSTIDAERVTSLRTGNVATVAIEGTISSAVTSPVLTAFASVVPGDRAPIGLVTKIKNFTYNPGGAGDFEIDNWPKGPRIIAVHVHKADANTVTLKTDSFAQIDVMTKAALQNFQDEEGRVPVSGITVLDFCANGNLDEALRTAGVQDLRATIDYGSGGAHDVTVEYLDTFDGL